MQHIERIKQAVDLHDLAARLGLERPDQRGNYRSPHHDDRNPSLAIWPDGRWSDFSSDEHGDAIDLVQYVRQVDTSEALDWLRREYGIERPQPAVNGQAQRRLSLPESIWYRSSKTDPAAAVEYLTEQRGLPDDTVAWAIQRGAVGCNDWSSPTVGEGSVGHGGLAVAFPCRRVSDGRVMGVDMRYIDPDLNGGLKTSSQGEKDVPYIPCLRRFRAASTIYVVESAINALTIESLKLPRTSTLATRGTSTWRTIDWTMLAGKRVILAMDADEPDDAGRRPGPEAAWAILEQLTALNIPCEIVDQAKWYAEGKNDCNDILKDLGAASLRAMVTEIEPWLIPGLPADNRDNPVPGRKRMYLPAHDWALYWRYRTHTDFTRYIDRLGEGDDEQTRWKDVCGFRIAGISRVQIADHNSVLSGEQNAQPEIVFSISAQRPGSATEMERRVLDPARLHKLDLWEKFGGIFSPAIFRRLLSIMERTTGLTTSEAVNFVGLCWRDGKLVVNEGSDCYFQDPESQCPYHALRLPSGTLNHAHEVIEAYRRTYSHHAALRMLVWSVGAHCKALIGYWPHMTLQGPKGSGKSIMTGRLERTIAMHMYGSEQIKTAYRLMSSTSMTSHPIGWEEISANDQRVIDAAVTVLQQCYQAAHTTRGRPPTPYLMSAPVLLAGEDTPVKSLTGKLVAEDLTGKTKGELMPEELPQFPVREWLEHLAEVGRDRARSMQAEWNRRLLEISRADDDDHGAQRMIANYAAVMMAAELLFDWAECPHLLTDFFGHLGREMNQHMASTQHDREPWVWIMEHVLADIDSGQFDYPYGIRDHDGADALVIKPRHIIQHLQTTPRYRQVWDAMPIKTSAVFTRQLKRAGVILSDTKELTDGGRRYQRMAAMCLDTLDHWGLDVARDITQADTDQRLV